MREACKGWSWALCLALCLALAATAHGEPHVGWRNNGSGHFPGVEPPLKWLQSGHASLANLGLPSVVEGLKWKVPVSEWANASPVVVGKRLFITIEPATLACLDTETGKLLWAHENHHVDGLPPKERARAKALLKERPEVERGLEEAERELAKLRRVLRSHKASAEAMEAFREKEQRVDALREKLAGYPKPLEMSAEFTIGFASSTPVSDGSRVWALFANGALAAYTLDGRRDWIKTVGKQRIDMFGWDDGHAASPLLVDGTLVVGLEQLVGLDPKTGKVRWRAGDFRDYGTPAVATIGDVGVVFTASGRAFRARDGHQLADQLTQLVYTGPAVHERVLYFVGNNMIQQGGTFEDNARATAWLLPSALGESLVPKRLWDRELPWARHYTTPLVHKGLLYTCTQRGKLIVMDASSGETVYSEQIFDKGIDVYSGPVLAGGAIYLGNEHGKFVAVATGRTYKLLGSTTLEKNRSTFFFSGRRAYLRTLNHVYALED